MSQADPIVAAPCHVGHATCPGAHACLFKVAGAWRNCASVILREEHVRPPVDPRISGTGQERAA